MLYGITTGLIHIVEITTILDFGVSACHTAVCCVNILIIIGIIIKKVIIIEIYLLINLLGEIIYLLKDRILQ